MPSLIGPDSPSPRVQAPTTPTGIATIAPNNPPKTPDFGALFQPFLNSFAPSGQQLANLQYQGDLNNAQYQSGMSNIGQNYQLGMQQLGLQQGALGRQQTTAQQQLSNSLQQDQLSRQGLGLNQQSLGLQQGSLADQLAAVQRNQPIQERQALSGALSRGAAGTAGFADQTKQSQGSFQDQLSALDRQKQELGISGQQLDIQGKRLDLSDKEIQQNFDTTMANLSDDAARLGISKQELQNRYQQAADQLGLDRNTGALQLAQAREQMQSGQISSALQAFMPTLTQYLTQFGLAVQ